LNNRDRWEGEPEHSRETKYIPQDGIRIEDAIDIERRVDDKGLVENSFPYITGRIEVRRISWQWKTSLWRIGDIF